VSSPAQVDPWLGRWLPLAAERAGRRALLELGCGEGSDDAVLASARHAIVGIDLSAESLARARARVSSGRFLLQDAGIRTSASTPIASMASPSVSSIATP
jgi:SAM-dependent methyltransferase